MLKFCIKLIILIILAVVIYKKHDDWSAKLHREYGLQIKLFVFYGGKTSYWLTDQPSEYRYGNKIWYTKHGRRIQYQTGLSKLCTPRQAWATILWIKENLPAKPNGARIIESRKLKPDRSSKAGYLWRFDKSPFQYGIRPIDHRRIIEAIYSTFVYDRVDKWAVKTTSDWPNGLKEAKLCKLGKQYAKAADPIKRAAIAEKARRLSEQGAVNQSQYYLLTEYFKHVEVTLELIKRIKSQGWIDTNHKTRHDYPE